MRTANEIRAARLREAACCKSCAQGKDCDAEKVSADRYPPKGDGGVEVRSEDEDTFVSRAARAIIEGEPEPPTPEPKSPALSRALAGVRAGLRAGLRAGVRGASA